MFVITIDYQWRVCQRALHHRQKRLRSIRNILHIGQKYTLRECIKTWNLQWRWSQAHDLAVSASIRSRSAWRLQRTHFMGNVSVI